MAGEKQTTSKEKSKSKPGKISRSAAVRPYRIVSWLSLLLFVSLIGYLIYFQLYESDGYRNHTRNKRQEIIEEQIVRGPILAAGGEVLAKTDIAADGAETRTYPYGDLFAHTVGYAMYGGSGLELTQGSTLLQSHTNLVTQVQTDLQEQKKQGDQLVTTLDVKLQQAASDALGDNLGAVVVLSAADGRVLADVSKPTFDPNALAENWDSLTQDDRGIFLNRPLQGLYPPGSTFKIITALAYLRQYGSFDNFHYTCTSTYEQAGFQIHCFDYEAHGEETFADAMANSCNCAFAYMASELIEPEHLRQAAESLGFNTQPALQLPAAKSVFSMTADSPTALIMQTGIGQGDTLATPMQMALAAQAVANRGHLMLPTYVDSVKSADGRTVKTYEGADGGAVMTEAEAAALQQIMRAVVERGTAARFLADLPYNIAGKTGTAEYGDVAANTAHSWFTGFSNTGSNDIVVCVLIEGGGSSNAPAAAAARNIFVARFGG